MLVLQSVQGLALMNVHHKRIAKLCHCQFVLTGNRPRKARGVVCLGFFNPTMHCPAHSRSRTSEHYLWATYQLRPLCMVAFQRVWGSSGWLDLNSVQIRHFWNRAVKQTVRNKISKFEYDVAPRALCTFWNFCNCTVIFAKVTGT